MCHFHSFLYSHLLLSPQCGLCNFTGWLKCENKHNRQYFCVSECLFVLFFCFLFLFFFVLFFVLFCFVFCAFRGCQNHKPLTHTDHTILILPLNSTRGCMLSASSYFYWIQYDDINFHINSSLLPLLSITSTDIN